MKNSRRISNKIEKKYKRPIDNLYSYRFYEDLFTNYAYSLSEKKFDRSDFFMIVSDDKEIVKYSEMLLNTVFHMNLNKQLMMLYIVWPFMDKHIFL